METAHTFKPNFVLIDFENVQPKNLAILKDERFQIRLFLGAKQTRLDMRVVDAMHEFGVARAKYIRAMESGKDALDFFITYYLGQLVAEHPQGYFHIISKDKGFDPLITHLKDDGVKVYRRASLLDIPILSVAKNAAMAEKMKAALANLTARGTSRPLKEKTLKNTLKYMFKDTLTDDEVAKLFDSLVEAGQITVSQDKIKYHLSDEIAG